MNRQTRLRNVVPEWVAVEVVGAWEEKKKRDRKANPEWYREVDKRWKGDDRPLEIYACRKSFGLRNVCSWK